MTQEEITRVLSELKGFCERNIGNRLSEDLCNALLGRVQASFRIDQPRATSAAEEVKRIQEDSNALS